MHPLSPSENSPHIKVNCTGCGRCVAACQLGALTLESDQPNGFGRKRAVVRSGRCTECRGCLLSCPHKALAFAG